MDKESFQDKRQKDEELGKYIKEKFREKLI